MFTFQRLDAGPKWTIIKSDFPRRSAAEAYAIDWLAARNFVILLMEHDDGNNAIDIMAARNDALEQFAIEPSR